ncbi:hypothetical protein QJS04_geneDACA006864 [Acorus gramineus]|uniref:F-box associated beta-propeller type 3 domain-containing protein n=1 Tax=Acorus gramineus TaxID=55184 RepID=A0AAV9AZG4_ACOGR|nr:hypothetical protein QJS04_geneDACA006864 [Acorus gramineus]
MESWCNEGKKEEMETDQTVRFLCEDLLIDILFRHEAVFLHRVLRHVCQPWHDIIREPWFARAHLERSRPRIVGPLGFPVPSDRSVSDACDGLLLLSPKDHNDQPMEILNPITGIHDKLPDNKLGCGWGDATPVSWTLATSSSTGEYKVVHTSNTTDNEVHVEIITLEGGRGKNAWRDISRRCPGLADVRWIKTDGFLHAVSRQGHPYLHCHTYMGTLDLVKETFKEMRLPPCCERRQFSLLESRDRHLLLADHVSLTQFDVWMSRDDEGEEWMKLYSFTNADWFKGLMPLDPEVVAKVNSITAISGSGERKRLVLLVEVMEDGWVRKIVWVLCEEEGESGMVELSGEESFWVETKFSLGYRPVHEYVDSLISWRT